MVLHWRLIDSKSPQVSRTLLTILAVFNNAVVWMVSSRPPTSKSFRPFNNPLVTVPKTPITIGIIVTFIVHSYLSFPLLSFLFCGLPGQQSRQFCRFSFFVNHYKVWSSGQDSFVYQSPRGVCVCHLLGQVLGCAYTICLHGQI